MPMILPVDSNGFPISALSLRPDGAHKISALTSSSVRNINVFSSDTSVISLYADGPIYFRLGNASTTAAATDHYLPPANIVYIATNNSGAGRARYLATLAAEYDCTVYISECG